MKSLRPLFLFITILYSTFGFAQSSLRYRISFTDKDISLYSINKPEEFLSQRAIDRRIKQGINISYSDIPVNSWYIDSIIKTGVRYCNTSKWFNSIVVEIDSTFELEKITNFPFVYNIKKIGLPTVAKPNAKPIKIASSKDYDYSSLDNVNAQEYYGDSYDQIAIMNGVGLHKDGYMGQNMMIAVIDGGFTRVDSISAFKNAWNENRILAYKDFSGSNINVFEEGYHGTAVFSLIGSYLPGTLIGTAPRAQYLLLRTEESNSEFPAEEENWLAAIEFADSMGVDVVNSSLGYSEFDDSTYNYSYLDMNGITSRISQAAELAADKGILVVTSAGNAGNKPWRFITSPGDANKIITVGAVYRDSTVTGFSSRGPTADGRLKPELVTLGYKPAVIRENGLVEKASMGTSFSSPLLAGMITCLWQEFSNLTVEEIQDALFKSGQLYFGPNFNAGYGIPDFEKARKILRIQMFSEVIDYAKLYPNPFSDKLILEVLNTDSTEINIDIFSTIGSKVLSTTIPLESLITQFEIPRVDSLQKGVYVVVVSFGKIHHAQKIIKQ